MCQTPQFMLEASKRPGSKKHYLREGDRILILTQSEHQNLRNTLYERDKESDDCPYVRGGYKKEAVYASAITYTLGVHFNDDRYNRRVTVFYENDRLVIRKSWEKSITTLYYVELKPFVEYKIEKIDSIGMMLSRTRSTKKPIKTATDEPAEENMVGELAIYGREAPVKKQVEVETFTETKYLTIDEVYLAINPNKVKGGMGLFYLGAMCLISAPFVGITPSGYNPLYTFISAGAGAGIVGFVIGINKDPVLANLKIVPFQEKVD